MSGYSEEIVQQKGVLLVEPHTPFLAKPFTRQALLQKVHDALCPPIPED